jgi:hypothetical protein
LKSHKDVGKKLGLQARKEALAYYNWQRFGKEVEEVITASI